MFVEVSAAGVTGWANSRFLLYIAAPRDITAGAVTTIGFSPTAPSMDELGQIVVDALGPPPDDPSRVLVVVDRVPIGPPAELTFDEFFGEEYGDDSVAGTRYRVVGHEAGGVFVLDSVESIGLCWRGVSGDLCV